MLPTLKPEQLIIASSLSRPRKGSIVIANISGLEVIKRVDEIKRDDYWLISDNLNAGTDSRHYGPINKKQIIGTCINCALTATISSIIRGGF